MTTKLTMVPATGERLLRFVGDRARFALRTGGREPLGENWRAFLRTNLGNAKALRREIIQAHAGTLRLGGAAWRDIPMSAEDGEWSLALSLTEPGYFEAKAYAVDPQGRQHWPEGPNVGLSIHPNADRAGNTIYCAFVRLFGKTKAAVATQNERLDAQLAKLDKLGYAVIPASGKLRDLMRELPHIFDTLGCRILHLLPINPTPATCARFGRFGSPYAGQDLTAIDPALVEFDRRTTGIDQFRELACAVHLKGGRVFLDLVINHTGWGSTLQENHPGWFLRGPDGLFVSPGAWGTTWEDLVELNHRNPASWDYLAEAFLTWCRRGVDGFRCDAGYKVPASAWQYITACVRREFPETLFLLEGLGGAWEATENLLTEGGMQWAYSELFQNFSGVQAAGYLDHSLRQSARVGLLVHYSETHDNERLAKRGRAWSLMRNQLCALASVSGGYGFTCGVEWLASEKILVHASRGLAWGNPDNLVPELARLNRLLAGHPCFFDGATLTRLSPIDSMVYALRRDSAEGKDHALVLANLDIAGPQSLALNKIIYQELGSPRIDLLGQSAPAPRKKGDQELEFRLAPGTCYCLAASATPLGLAGDEYHRSRAQAAWAIQALGEVLVPEEIGPHDWRALAKMVATDAEGFLASLARLDRSLARRDLLAALAAAGKQEGFPQVVTWRLLDRRRITLVPPQHWLLLRDTVRFRATLDRHDGSLARHVASVPVRDGHIACFAPAGPEGKSSPGMTASFGDAELTLERYTEATPQVQAQVRFLSPDPVLPESGMASWLAEALRIRRASGTDLNSPLVLLTNGRGGMARLCVDLGSVKSKYDCLLGANLHPALPVDRHVLAKRVRVWVNANGFISPLNLENLVSFAAGPPAAWQFAATAGDGHAVEIQLVMDMLAGRNTTVLQFSRPLQPPALGKDLPPECEVRLTVRVDIEDRSFHAETKRHPGADDYFGRHCHVLRQGIGFAFAPAPERHLRVFSTAGLYNHEAEWSENIPHPLEQSRGQVGSGDAYSPGWFDLPLSKGAHVTVVVCADPTDPEPELLAEVAAPRRGQGKAPNLPEQDRFGNGLAQAVRAFVVRRGSSKTIVAGYPWFLDWGRDTLICARGLLAAGLTEEVRQLLVIFGRLEEQGTLPNVIHGEDTSNRETSDAPLWYGVVCEEAAALCGPDLYKVVVDEKGRAIADVLCDIARSYRRGTPKGIQMDEKSGLIWSPKHFTWMDTNYPAATPREGYPVEIQVLWIRLLRQLAGLRAKSSGENWDDLRQRAQASFDRFFWLEDRGCLADLLIAPQGVPAAEAVADNALRSNGLFAVTFGLVNGLRARRCVEAALKYLVVPGALRSLAPLPVSPPLPVLGPDGRLLHNPSEPYWGRYEGDEDSRRKPAYHNGTAWTWTFPSFCEALARAWDCSAPALVAARAYLGSMDRLLAEGCVGQLPEIVDGDAPHQQRGCDAQAWPATEALRVWRLLTS